MNVFGCLDTSVVVVHDNKRCRGQQHLLASMTTSVAVHDNTDGQRSSRPSVLGYPYFAPESILASFWVKSGGRYGTAAKRRGQAQMGHPRAALASLGSR